jgi:hypothetical protein
VQSTFKGTLLKGLPTEVVIILKPIGQDGLKLSFIVGRMGEG